MDTKNIHEPSPPKEELPEDTPIVEPRCGNCRFYRKINRGLGCRKRGGLRSPVGGTDCRYFEVRNE